MPRSQAERVEEVAARIFVQKMAGPARGALWREAERSGTEEALERAAIADAQACLLLAEAFVRAVDAHRTPAPDPTATTPPRPYVEHPPRCESCANDCERCGRVRVEMGA